MPPGSGSVGVRPPVSPPPRSVVAGVAARIPGQVGCRGCRPSPAAQVQCINEAGWTGAGYQAPVPFLSLSHDSGPRWGDDGGRGVGLERGLGVGEVPHEGQWSRGRIWQGWGNRACWPRGSAAGRAAHASAPPVLAGGWVAGGCRTPQRSPVTLGTR